MNDAPVVSGISDQTVLEGNSFDAFDLDSYLTEVDGDAIVWSYSGNTELSVSVDADNIVTVSTPDDNWNGSESISFTASDDNAESLSNSDEVVFTVTAVNDAPVAGSQDLTTDEDSGLSILLSGTDADGDVLSYEVVTDPANGSLSGTAVSYTHLRAHET